GDVIRGIQTMVKKGPPSRQQVNLNDLVLNVVHMINPNAMHHSCEVQTLLEANLPPIEADPIQLQQVLINLVINAFDAMRNTPLSRRKVVIATERNGDGLICMSVRDYGTGISEQARERLFDHFFTTKAEGLGMGLGIVRSIVESHGGTVAGENVESASDFLARPLHSGPSCVIVDVQMPGINGMDLQETLIQHSREEQLVFITGHGDIPMCAQAMKAGAVDFLRKPFRDDELLQCVERALIRSAEHRRRNAEKDETRRLLDLLTPREFEVMQLVITGMLNKQIAGELGTAEKTVKVHRGRVMQKLGVTSVAELVMFMQRAGLASAAKHKTKV